jgi:sporulation integral membrane protein YlbJ
MKKIRSLSGAKVVKFILILSIIFLIVALAVYPEKYSKSTYKGVLLWAVSVMPSLLPYFFLTAILTKTNCLTSVFCKFSKITEKLFRLGGISCYAFFMSVLSGYPVGSKLTADLYQNDLIGKGEASRLSLLCSTSGPLFIIGAVGVSMLNSKVVGFIIYVAHVLSAVVTALIFRNVYEPPIKSNRLLKSDKSDNLLYDAVYSSVISVLVVGGFVAVFYVISEILLDFNILYPINFLIDLILKPLSNGGESLGVTLGLIEFTKGAKMLSSLTLTPLTVSLISFIITFGGVSVIMQSLAFLKKARVKTSFFVLGKLVQGIVSFILCFAFCLVFL